MLKEGAVQADHKKLVAENKRLLILEEFKQVAEKAERLQDYDLKNRAQELVGLQEKIIAAFREKNIAEYDPEGNIRVAIAAGYAKLQLVDRLARPMEEIEKEAVIMSQIKPEQKLI